MNEQLHSFATNYIYAVPFVMVLTAVFLHWQKQKVKHAAKNTIFNNSFIIRNSFFVGAVTFALMYLGRPLPGLDENMIVAPADF